MLVEQIMQSTLVTVTPETTLPEALRLTRQRGVRHLLVVEHDRLAGIVSDRDLKRAMASPAASLEVRELDYLLARLAMSEIMTRAVITIAPNAPVEEAARLLVREKISALPVTLGGRLLGIVTETDVLQLFVRALGAGQPSSRLDVRLGPGRSALADVVQIVEAAGTPVSSVMTLAEPDGSREVVIRLPTINPVAAVRALEARGYPVTTPWRE
jgi:acetoin utilization protein AcuB